MIKRFLAWRRVCRRIGHRYVYEAPSVGGEWIRCKNCGKLEECIPGVHEPQVYLGVRDNEITLD